MTAPSKPAFTAGPAIVPLNKGAVTIIDNDDLPLVAEKKWRVGNGYAVHSFRACDGKVKTIRMHRIIMDAPPELEVDHINGDRLDNRRSNLRLCTPKQNNQNRPKHNTGGVRPYKGVRKRNNRYVAEIRIGGGNIALGSFLTAEDAAFAYDCAAKKHYGEFANLNGVSGNPSPRVLQNQATEILAETGMTPRELAERCKELEALVRKIDEEARHRAASEGREPPRYTLNRIGGWTRAALAKATGGASHD